MVRLQQKHLECLCKRPAELPSCDELVRPNSAKPLWSTLPHRPAWTSATFAPTRRRDSGAAKRSSSVPLSLVPASLAPYLEMERPCSAKQKKTQKMTTPAFMHHPEPFQGICSNGRLLTALKQVEEEGAAAEKQRAPSIACSLATELQAIIYSSLGDELAPVPPEVAESRRRARRKVKQETPLQKRRPRSAIAHAACLQESAPSFFPVESRPKTPQPAARVQIQRYALRSSAPTIHCQGPAETVPRRLSIPRVSSSSAPSSARTAPSEREALTILFGDQTAAAEAGAGGEGGGGKIAPRTPKEGSALARSVRRQPDTTVMAEPTIRQQATDEALAPWGQEKLQKLFNTFDRHKDREVHVDDVKNMLKLLGVSEDSNVIMGILQEQTRYSTLNWDEFVEFMRKFKAWERTRVRSSFALVDINQDGFIDLTAASKLLTNSGYKLTQATLSELAKGQSIADLSQIDLAAFERLLHSVRSNQGFTDEEIRRLRDLFCATSREEVDADDVWRILLYRGFPADLERVRALAIKLDLDGNGNLNFREMVEIVRVQHERDNAQVESMLQTNDHWKEQSADSVFGEVVQNFGYYISEGAIAECLQQLRQQQQGEGGGGEEGGSRSLQAGSWTPEDLIVFMDLYRDKQGFSDDETQELREAFAHGQRGDMDDFADAPSTPLNLRRLGTALRWIGHHPGGQDRLHEAVKEVTLRGDRRLDFAAFKTLVYQLRHNRMLRRKQVFAEHEVADWQDRPRMKVKEIMDIVQDIRGASPKAEWVYDAITSYEQKWCKSKTEGNIMSFRSFERLFVEFFRVEVLSSRKTAGYVQTEVDWLRLRFRKYDRDNSGEMDAREMSQLLEEVFSQKWPTLELAQVLDAADVDRSGEVSFEEFLWFVREHDDRLGLSSQMGRVGNGVNVDAAVAIGLRDIFKHRRLSTAAFSKRRSLD